jgi:hypothetical protein
LAEADLAATKADLRREAGPVRSEGTLLRREFRGRIEIFQRDMEIMRCDKTLKLHSLLVTVTGLPLTAKFFD